MSQRAYAEISPYASPSVVSSADRRPPYLFPSYQQQQRLATKRTQAALLATRRRRQQEEFAAYECARTELEQEEERFRFHQRSTRLASQPIVSNRVTQTQRVQSQRPAAQQEGDASTVDNIDFTRIYGIKVARPAPKQRSPDKSGGSEAEEHESRREEELRLIQKQMKDLASKQREPSVSADVRKREATRIRELESMVGRLQEELREVRDLQFQSLVLEQQKEQREKQRIAEEKAREVVEHRQLDAGRVRVVKRLSGTDGHPSLFVFHQAVVEITRAQIDELIKECGNTEQTLAMLADLQRAGLQFETLAELTKAVHSLPRSEFVAKAKYAHHETPFEEGKYEEPKKSSAGKAVWHGSPTETTTGQADAIDPSYFIEHPLHHLDDEYA